jgi:diguanylate cyclase (GGDEF)-like protein
MSVRRRRQDRDQTSADGRDRTVHELSQDIRRRVAREHSASERMRAASAGDLRADAGDLSALARDRVAEALDFAIALVDDAYDLQDAALAVTATERDLDADLARELAARARAQAAEQRSWPALDRRAAAEDRARAAGERLRARADREAFARLVAIVETDPLTGARTRAAGLADLDAELQRCARTSGRLVVAYVDVVGLRDVNDSAGRCAGDELLVRVAGLINAHVRPYDLIIRLGGGEFLCAMSNLPMMEMRRRFAQVAVAIAYAPDEGAIRTGFAAFAHDESATELIARSVSDLRDGPGG